MSNSNENSTAGFKNAKDDLKCKNSDTVENGKGVENHIKAAQHFYAASKCHYEAAKHHKDGNHETANQCALLALSLIHI